MLTLFTFGYYGWGNATRELVRAIDATERKRGFKPPVFFDIRYRRNVRAVGFREDSFGQLLSPARYRWFPRLGNENIKTREPGIRIADPFSSRILLEEALRYAKENRRVIFFCSCRFPRDCHRQVVAKLILRDAERTGHRIKITEWPGGEPIRKRLRVTEAIYAGIRRETLKNVPLSSRMLPRDFIDLPWGSMVDVVSGKENIPIVSGPAKFQSGWWLLPIEYHGKPNTSAVTIHGTSQKWLKSNGIKSILSSPRPSRNRVQIKALSVRQPWAHAIIHLGKDVENRSWRRDYTGPLLIHASAHHEPNPQRLLSECMVKPPPQGELLRLSTGSIIGVVELFDYTKDSSSKWAEKGFWHLHVRNARPIKPVKCKGQLGLWTPQPSVMKKLPAWGRKLH